MKKQMTYNLAFDTLEKLVHEIEDDNILLDQLSHKVKEANDMILFCEKKLRNIEVELKNSNETKIKSTKKKDKPT